MASLLIAVLVVQVLGLVGAWFAFVALRKAAVNLAEAQIDSEGYVASRIDNLSEELYSAEHKLSEENAHMHTMLVAIGDMVEAIAEKQVKHVTATTTIPITKAAGWAQIRVANEKFNRDQERERVSAEKDTDYVAGV